MIPSRPWPMIVRGRMIVTSWPAATASSQSELGLELGAAVVLERAARRVLPHRVACSGIPNTALDDVCTTFVTPASRAATSRLAVPTTFTEWNSAAILRERHLRDVVEHDVDAVAGAAQRVPVADVAGDELDRVSVRRRREVEDPHRVAAGARLVDEHGPEVAASRP